ncbi:MAG: hypothetical protein WD009_08010, partial [Phycisphaeraceae bacterium]
MLRRKRTMLLAGFVASGMLATPAMAQTEWTWAGLNSDGVDETTSTGNSESADVNDEFNWLPELEFGIPTVGDTAIFHYTDDKRAYPTIEIENPDWDGADPETQYITVPAGNYEGAITIDGAFAASHIRLEAGTWQRPLGNLVLGKDLTIETLFVSRGYTTGQGPDFVVGSGFTLTMTGENPLEFGGNQGGWHGLVVESGATLEFAGASHTFDNYYSGYFHGTQGHAGFRSLAGGGEVAITGEGATIILGDPGTSHHAPTSGPPAVGAIRLGAQQFSVRSDQTWLNPSGHAVIALQAIGNESIVGSIDGGRLDNLGEIGLVISHSGNNENVYLEGGTYKSLYFTRDATSGRLNNTRLLGDVSLTGGTIIPGIAGDGETIPDTPASESDYSIIFAHGRVYGNVIRLDGHDLTTARGILIRKDGGSHHPNQAIAVDASGGTLTVGGDIVLEEVVAPAGTTSEGNTFLPDPEGEEWQTAPNQGTAEEDGYVFNEDLQEWGQWGDTVVANLLNEFRRVGLHGDMDTVINLHGSFSTNARSATVQGSGLFESTVNMIGTGNTFEVAANAADEIVAQTYAIGNFNVGTSSDTASIQLVNNSVNDGSVVVDGSGNETRINDDEVLLTNNLSIAAGSTLDVNGQGVAVHGSLSIDATGTLDLNTGLTLNDEDIVTSFFGVGNQAAAWN